MLYRQGHYEKALEEYKLAEELDTEWCEILRLLSSFLAHVPDAEFHDAAEAVHLAEKAVDQHVDYRMHDSNHSLPLDLRVLGQAYYRANRFEECVHALTRTIGLSTDGADASDCFFLAMAHQMLGDPREASKWFDAGVEWMDGNQMSVPDETDFTRWRGEARRVLDE